MKKILKNKKISIILSSIRVIATLLACFIVVIVFVQRLSNNKLSLGGYSIYTIITESMKPKYQVGDMIVAKKKNIDNIEIGNDIVYLGEEGDFKDKIVTHRVIDKQYKNGKYIFTTKGINNDVEDPFVNQEQVYGVVIYKTILLSFLSKIVSNTYGFYFIIFIPFAIMVFLEILDVIKEKEELKKCR